MEGENWFEAAYQDLPRRNGGKARQSKMCALYEKKKSLQTRYICLVFQDNQGKC